MASELIQKQRRFAQHLGLLLTVGLEQLRLTYPSASFRMAEGYVGDSIDQPGEVSPHLRHGGHFKRLAQDLILDINDVSVHSSDHHAWQILEQYWIDLDPENRTLRRIGDANHFSVFDRGVA